MTRRYIDNYLTDAGQLLARLAQQLPDLERRLTAWAKDGYPSQSGAPGGAGTISDPTAQAVVTPDRVRLDREQLHANIIRLHDIAVTLDMIRRTYMEPKPDKQPQPHTLAKCSNMHGCPDDAWADKAGRCSACYQYLRRTQRDRTNTAA